MPVLLMGCLLSTYSHVVFSGKVSSPLGVQHRLYCTTDKNEIWRPEPSLWLAQLYGTVYQQQFVKLTACIHLSASSKHICLHYVLMTD